MLFYIVALELNSSDLVSLEKIHKSMGRCFVIGNHCNPLDLLWHSFAGELLLPECNYSIPVSLAIANSQPCNICLCVV